MNLIELTETSRPNLARGQACVLLAVDPDGADSSANLESLASLLANTPAEVPLAIASTATAEQLRQLLDGEHSYGARELWLVSGDIPARGDATTLTSIVNRALALLAPTDIALLSRPCRVAGDWLARLRNAAYDDSNTASASALSDSAGALAVWGADRPPGDLSELARRVADHSLLLRPRLNVLVGPCSYLRRDALELVGSLDDGLELRGALEVDFAGRCLLTGLAHVAADDVLIADLGGPTGEREHEHEEKTPQQSQDRRQRLGEPLQLAASATLPRALEAVRRPQERLWVTVDARALNASLTGTQRYILELIRALAATGRLRLRLLVAGDTDEQVLDSLRSMPQTELLAAEAIDEATPRSPVFHRPQQVFGPPDMRMALSLGERIVLNQLDLIAYRNPGYHASATAWHSHRRASRQALAAADRVVVFSEHTRAELLNDELAEDERVRIVPPGLDHQAATEPIRPAALGSFLDVDREQGTQTSDFLLCLGTDFRHKNRPFALKMLAALREHHGWRGRLVLAGTHIPNGSSLELERELLRSDPQLQAGVVDLGVVTEAEKLWLMRSATAVVYPSAYEGFGLVPFEAGLSGTPCLFAARSSLAEVLPGESAAIVPWSARASAEQALPLLVDQTARAKHVEALAAAARRLTWQATAAALVELYEEAAVASTREAAELSRDELDREQEVRGLVADQDALVAQLATERDHARAMYDSLNAEVGSGLSLIGPNGALPADLQNGLLALSAQPVLSRRLFGAAAGLFRIVRAVGRRVSG
ncbi:MAG TPA: glycosyltransferase [Solirubrobacteraceae bacterium]|jgi:glycosyltransferase involved in cell wall biosynthesis